MRVEPGERRRQALVLRLQGRHATLQLHQALWPQLEAVAALRKVLTEIEVPLVSVLAAQAANPHWQWYVDTQGGPRPDGCHHGLWVNDDAAEQQNHLLDWLKAHATS